MKKRRVVARRFFNQLAPRTMYKPSQSQQKPARKSRPKVFLDYPMQLAFERIEFYLRVLEAHFEKLGAPRVTKADALPPEDLHREIIR